MDSASETAETNNVLSQVLDALSVTSTAFLDDRHTPPFSDIFAMALARRNHEALGELPGFSNIDWNDDEDLVREEAEQLFEDLSLGERRRLYDALGGEDADFDVPDDLTNIWPSEVELVHPEGWEEWSAARLGEERCMLFLDLDLGVGEEHGGAERLKSLVEQEWEPDRRPIAVILTHNAGPDAQSEQALWNELVERHELPQNSALVISKKRTSDPDALAQHLRSVFMLNLSQDMVRWASAVARDSLDEAVESLGAVDADVLERIVVASSRREGISPLETLFRLLDTPFSTARFSNARAPKRHCQFEQYSAALSALNDIAPGPPSDMGVARQLQHAELYQRDLGSGAHVSPPWLGDIFLFERKKSRKNRYYILLYQPCDLVLRSDGRRKAPHVHLLRIQSKPQVDSRLKKRLKEGLDRIEFAQKAMFHGKARGVLPYYWPDTEFSPGFVEFRGSVLGNLDRLDLICLLDDRLPESGRTVHALPGVKERIGHLLSTYDSSTKPTYVAQPPPNDDFFDHVIRAKRVARLKPTRARALLKAYLDFRGRPAFEHEFGG